MVNRSAEETLSLAWGLLAAMATRGEVAIEVQVANVMGVSIPIIEQKHVARSTLGRGYSITGTSVTIDEAATAFEAEVDSLIQLAG